LKFAGSEMQPTTFTESLEAGENIGIDVERLQVRRRGGR
jgi:hypothetical protein